VWNVEHGIRVGVKPVMVPPQGEEERVAAYLDWGKEERWWMSDQRWTDLIRAEDSLSPF
jgi:hypothetical protein